MVNSEVINHTEEAGFLLEKETVNTGAPERC